MPDQPLKIVQHKHSAKQSQTLDAPEKSAPSTQYRPLLFVHRDQENLQGVRNAEELERIKQHLARRHRKKHRGHRKLEIHPSINRILHQALPDDKDDQHANEDATSLVHTSDGITGTSQSVNVPYTESLIRSALNANVISDGTLDPFTPLQESSSEVRRLLFLYCRHLRPLARAVSSEWDWAENLGEIQSSQMLTLAIAAYASAFFTGLKSGARGIALPPVPERGRQLLWPMPTWFRFQTQALGLLNIALLDREKTAATQVFHTIVFLFRLAVLFGDGLTANMHFKALRRVAQLHGRDVEDISRELAVTKINFITVFLYKAALIKRKQRAITEEHPDYVIEPDRDRWTDEKEWNKFQSMLFGRSLTWNARSPGSTLQTEARLNILRLDTDAAQLPEAEFFRMVQMYQVALYLWSHLTNIAFDPSSPKIRYHTEELEQYLQQPDIEHVEDNAPKVVFFLFFVGAFSSRGLAAWKWFIRQLARSRIQVWYMRDVYAELDGHCDPSHCMPVLLEEILTEIRQVKQGNVTIKKSDLYQGGCYRNPDRGPTPMSYSPDLDIPIRDLEIIDRQQIQDDLGALNPF
ncbi:hypothetical protein OHC33_004774 [Knufia fluminis]|uniref:Uncharacterized protein n=1 Tax=Knufia fluminis TaxID=191047 RepID=A0AAN8I878_9EURO|nr:hypothetical protein OHC33_004774 [Knufia fluminis]